MSAPGRPIMSGLLEIVGAVRGHSVERKNRGQDFRGRGSVERGYPEETVGWAKQQRIIRAAFAYLIRKRLGEPPCRFDVVGIDSSGARLYRDAFRVQS